MGETVAITIAPMVRDDLEQVLAIERQSFSMPWSRNLFLSEFRSRTVSTLLVALAHGSAARAVIGYIVYWLVADEMHILNLAIAPPFRRRGAAKRLVQAALERAFECGARRSFLEVRASNTAAQKLYTAFGFVRAFNRAEYYDHPVEDAVVMTLEASVFETVTVRQKGRG